MLEIRNVTKIYHSKNGNSVRALDNISMTFPETGMVFILGKSGSGKSTLLNVIGGLDGYDSGEFVIKGKSSKDFGGSDFDAYRNTFIGFIFQEYNILDDFTVGANIGLALELQGKKATNEKISNILAQVDMLDYAKRKPNELSGGQKQRIAIARALVKDPEIIMADEPTGALDSNTGKQIFDTLKELSKTKLVIIVSHDRDFAEQYGDRIIEMKDGNILSDVTKHHVAAKEMSSGILQMNDNLLRIEQGYQLTLKDLELINAYLREQQTEILISGDRRINTGVRNTAGISSDNTSAVFKDTDEKKDVKVKEYDKKSTKFIRSRLPFKNAFKIGSSSLGHKKFRLTVTIFLSLIAFALFGFADTLGAYNKVVAATDSIMDSNVKNASFSLGVKHTWVYDEKSHSYYQTEAINDDDIKTLSEKTGISFMPVFNGSSYDNSTIALNQMMKSTDKIGQSTAYTGVLYGFAAPKAEDITRLGFNLTGKMPQKEDEIVISDFICKQFNLTGFNNSRENEEIKAGSLVVEASGGTNSIIGKHLTLNVNGMEYTFVISGVIDTGFDYDRYSKYVPSEDGRTDASEEESIMDMVMQKELQNTLEYGFHALGYITQTQLDNMAENMRNNFGFGSSVGMYINYWSLSLAQNSDTPQMQGGIKDEMIFIDQNFMNFSRVAQSSDMKTFEIKWLDGKERDKLGEKEIVISAEALNRISSETDITEKVSAILNEMYPEGYAQYLENREYYSLSEMFNVILDSKYYQESMVGIFEKEEVIYYLKERFEYDYKTEYGLDTEQELPEEYMQSFIEYCQARIDGREIFNQFVSMEDYEALKQAQCKTFAEKLFNKQYGADIPAQFYYDTVLQSVRFNIENQTFLVTKDSFRDMMIEEYVYSNLTAEIYNSDKFFNEVIKSYRDVGNDIKKEDYDALDDAAKKEDARAAYIQYIKNLNGQNPVEEDKDLNYFEKESDKLYWTISGKDEASLFDGYYLNKKTWDDNGNEISDNLDGYKIVGLFNDPSGMSSDLIISDTIYNEVIAYAKENDMGQEIVAPHEPGSYAFVIAPMPTDRASVQKLVEISYDENGDYQFSLQNQVMNTLGSFNDFIEMGAKIFLYVGIGFAVFSALMLMNFISVSISYKRREIGILRAVGARSSDVFKIFFSEAFLIALINYILSVAATIAATIFLNNLVRNEGINVTLLHFGVRQVALMLAISIFVAAVASFFPVWNIARRKPIDAIKNK